MKRDTGVRVRFAPSPTGPLHIGGARTALYNWLFARAKGGTFVLRIDDTDRARSTEESLQNILEAMRWLGLEWDEGPDRGGPCAPYFQSQRLEGYRRRVEELLASGQAYPCFCSPEQVEEGRERMQQRTGVGMYDRRCRHLDPTVRSERLAAGEPHTVRFTTPEGVVRVPDLIKGDVLIDLAQIDDWVMLREDGTPLYNLCSTLDDVDMRITHVIRGEEHFMNTVKQMLLFEALGHEPPQFAHLPLILGTDGKKLSKRKAQTNLLDYKQQGFPSEALGNFITLLGWGFDAERDLFTMQEAIERFDIDKLGRSGSIFDEEKLMWMCGVYLRDCPIDTLVARVAPFLVEAGLLTADQAAVPGPFLRNVVACYQERIRVYGELADKVSFLFADEIGYDAKAEQNLRKHPDTLRYLEAYRGSLAELQLPRSWPDRPADADAEVSLPRGDGAPPGCPYTLPAALEASARDVATSLGVGFGQLVHPVRAALTGTSAGAGLFDIVYLLGRQKVERRLDAAIAWLGQHPAGGS